MNVRTNFFALLLMSVATCYAHADEHEILASGSGEWKYHDSGKLPGEDWHKADFDDSAWESGKAPLGYGDDDIAQEISFGEDSGDKHPCAFFRRTVEVEDPSKFKKIAGKLVCDDGCAVYVNGEEVHRHNLPEGELKLNTKSEFIVGGEIERHGFTFVFDADKLKAGKNVIAVRVHQQGPDSSDMAIDISLAGLDDDDEVAAATETAEAEQAQMKLAAEQGF